MNIDNILIYLNNREKELLRYQDIFKDDEQEIKMAWRYAFVEVIRIKQSIEMFTKVMGDDK